MTTAAYAVVPAAFPNRITGFSITSGTIAKVIVETSPAVAATALTPLYYGGCTVLSLDATATDTASKDIQLWTGEVLTTQETSATGAMAITASTNCTITRAAGSFLTDRWKVGDSVMPFAPDTSAPNAASDGVVGLITAVVAGTLTVSGLPWSVVASLATGTRLARVAPLFRTTIPLSSGNTTAIAGYSLLNHANDPSSLRFEKKLGATNMLIAAMIANPSALTASVFVNASLAMY